MIKSLLVDMYKENIVEKLGEGPEPEVEFLTLETDKGLPIGQDKA